MKREDYIKGNTMIAQFMDWRLDNSFPDKGRVWRFNNTIELDTTFKYNKSWDVLMPVWNKISLSSNDKFEIDEMKIGSMSTIIKANGIPYARKSFITFWVTTDYNESLITITWRAIIEFIEYYNKQLNQ